MCLRPFFSITQSKRNEQYPDYGSKETKHTFIVTVSVSDGAGHDIATVGATDRRWD